MEQLKGHVSDELLNQLHNIKHHYIESEHPDHHWHLLKVKDETVLDFRMWLSSNRTRMGNYS